MLSLVGGRPSKGSPTDLHVETPIREKAEAGGVSNPEVQVKMPLKVVEEEDLVRQGAREVVEEGQRRPGVEDRWRTVSLVAIKLRKQSGPHRLP